jgi:hypothetical protein
MHHPPDVERYPVAYPDDLGEELRYREHPVTARAVLTLPPGGSTPSSARSGTLTPTRRASMRTGVCGWAF